MPPSTALGELLASAARSHPHRTAIAWGDTEISYERLFGRAAEIAGRFAPWDVPPAAVVGLVIENRVELIAAILAAIDAGVVFAPLDPFGPRERLAAMVREAAISRFVVESRFADLAVSLGARGDRSPLPARGDGSAELRCVGGTGPVATAQSIGGDDPCYIYFTSGSTGIPKAVLGSRNGLAHFVRWEIERFGLSGVRVSQLTPSTFDPFLRDVLVPLCAGGTVCVPDTPETVIDAALLGGWLDRARVELVHCVPTLFRALLTQQLGPGRFAALRHVLLAGERVLPEDVRAWREIFGDRIALVNLYGPTETTLAKLFHVIRPEDASARAVPIGRPIEGARALVLDEQDRACAPGTIGEIVIRTPFASLGYYRRPEWTRAVFVRNPFGDSEDDRIYRTGDLGRMDADGLFEFVGRRDEQVKIRGVRAELGEIESALRRHPAVRDVAVANRPDASGQGRLVAYVVASGELDPPLREFLAPHLEGAMIPSLVVRLEALPRTPSGKLDRRALPDPSVAEPERRAPFREPRGEAQETVARIWRELLAIERIGADDDFFGLGGHSLRATQMIARVGKALGVAIPLRVVFEAPTVAGIAEAAEVARRSAGPGHGALEPAAIPSLDRAARRLWRGDAP